MSDSILGRVTSAASRRTEGRAVALLVAVLILALALEPIVFTSYQVVLGRVALIGLVALGLTAVILVGELDLSVASTLALSGVVMASVPDIGWGVVAALATGLGVGLVNAFFVVVIRINSFIATLGMLFALRGLAFVLSGEEPVRLTNIDAGIAFGSPVLGPITPRVLLFFAVFLVLQVFLSRTRVGREFYAVGGNRQAAIDVGIPVRRRLVLGFAISGVVAALAGVVNTLERTAADPTAGSNVLLASFAAAIIGGVILTGGRGTVLGTLIGALALSVLQIVLTLSGVQVDIQDVFVGAILLIAVISDPSNLRTVAARLRTGLGRPKPQAPA
jgi:ribose transport system permease protein